MVTFFIGAAIAFVAVGVGTAHLVILQWRARSDSNWLRFVEHYADAIRLRDEARRAGDRA
ncbi:MULTISPECIES: hypothetical protein [unclassified Pseudoxanthomonas]|uniref:hypothetical protein n=1 Tax=unclassified Pseudoxanthomonas TaxID=2645906 RepID=UPI00307E0530